MQISESAADVKTNYNQIIFNKNDLGEVFGIAMSVFGLLGLERVLPEFKIISIVNRNYDSLLEKYVLKLVDGNDLKEQNTKSLIRDLKRVMENNIELTPVFTKLVDKIKKFFIKK